MNEKSSPLDTFQLINAEISFNELHSENISEKSFPLETSKCFNDEIFLND